ncbi:MAG: hypothetical protein EOO07_10555 [Chitinophagaceae bacterium]|nr:MAG: hypothetical protein EOO07_10555 [Chitinophagaceae bacterium]
MAVEAAKREKNDRAEAEAYAGLGEAYRLLRQDENALNAFRSAMAIMVRLNMFPGYYDVARGIAYTYLGAGKNALAIESYLHQMARFPATRNIDRFRYNVILTNLYVRSNDFKRATEHHNNAISLVPAGEHPDGLYSLTRTSAEFYYRFKEYDKARALFEHGNRVSGEKVDNLLRIASIDSANGNYQSAHRYGMRAKKLNDSLLSEARSKVVAGFQIKFDLKQKDNDLLMKDADLLYQKQRIRVLDQNALLLQQRTEIVAQEALLNSNRFLQAKLNADKDSIALRLKDQSITMLNKQASYQSLQLKEEAFSRKITYALIVLAIIVIILLIRQYLIKQRNSTVISEKNAQLEQLVKDKSWLLKEMHHRVKNNLQTVVSLLESQSAYLESDALAIVQNSQHRIFAMSLIHQRLYQHEQIASVDMSSYIPELTAYLKEYIGEDKYIAIEVDVDALHFDVSDAVPMGLILNEALTNAIKYAFKGRNSGKIMVSLKEISAGYRLRIIDDGVGLPLGFDISARDSLGLKLIRGLSHQLGGELLIQSNSGTEITVEGRNKLGS